MKLRTAVVAAVLVLPGAAAGCSGSDSSGSPAAKVAATSTPAVSAQTTCDLMFTDDHPRLWSQATELVVQAQNGEAWDTAHADDVARQLEEAASTSNPALRPHIEAMRAAVATPAGQSLDAGAFKLAAREVANLCTPYVAIG